jgi:hypothetical protein
MKLALWKITYVVVLCHPFVILNLLLSLGLEVSILVLLIRKKHVSNFEASEYLYFKNYKQNSHVREGHV